MYYVYSYETLPFEEYYSDNYLTCELTFRNQLFCLLIFSGNMQYFILKFQFQKLLEFYMNRIIVLRTIKLI